MQELKAYLGTLFDESSQLEKLDLLSISRDYVVDVLAAFTQSEQLFNDDPKTPTLAGLYQRATESSGQQQRIAFRRLGDTALFVCGLFNDHVERTPVGTSYYIDMGCAAYGRVSILSQSEVFRELSQKFPSIVEVLIHMADRTSLGTTGSLERVLERHSRNPNSRLLIDRLVREKAIPIFGIARS